MYCIFAWGEFQDRSFATIKIILVDALPLGLYNKDLKKFVNTDASNYGLGAYIYQINEKGEKTIISYDSRTLTDSEKRYATIEKEVLAVTWACEKYDDYINGIRIMILRITTHCFKF